MTIEEEKAALRREIRAGRRVKSAGECRLAGDAAFRMLRDTALWRGSRTVMAYAAVRGEMDLTALMNAALAEGKTLVLGRCEDTHLSCRLVRSLSELVPGAYGIPEPPEDAEIICPSIIDLILVPGLAFGRDGRRLGQGAGYYDRFLPGTDAFTLGVAYDTEVRESVPSRTHDAVMDGILTEKTLIRLKED